MKHCLRQTDKWYFMCICVWVPCLSVCVWPKEGVRPPGTNCSYRQLWASVWVLGLNLVLWRALSTPLNAESSPASGYHFLSGWEVTSLYPFSFLQCWGRKPKASGMLGRVSCLFLSSAPLGIVVLQANDTKWHWTFSPPHLLLFEVELHTWV